MTSRTSRILIVAAVIALGLPAAAAVYLLTLDLDALGARIGEAVEAHTGRALVADGPLRLEIGLAPRLEAADVRFANAPWGSRPDMITAKRIGFRLDLLPLLGGRISVRELDIDSADVLLERNAEDGRGNWSVGEAGGGGPAPLLPVVGRLRVADSVVTWRDPARGVEHVVRIPALLSTYGAAPHPVKLSGRLEVGGEPVSIEGAMDTVLARPFGLDLGVEAGGVSLAVAGTIAEPAAGTGIDLRFDLDAASLEQAGALAGRALPAIGPLRASAKLTGDRRRLSVLGLAARLGDTNARGTLQLGLEGERPRLEGELSLDRVDVRALSGGAGGTPPPAGRVIPPTPLPALALHALDAEIAVRIGDLLLPRLGMSNVEAALHLDAGALSVSPFTADVAGSRATGALDVDARSGVPAVRLRVDADDLDLVPLLAGTGVAGSFEGSGDLDVDVTGRGPDLAAVAASLDGSAALRLDAGRAKLSGIDTLVSGLAGLFTAKGADADGWTRLECGVAAMRFDRGKGASHALVDTGPASVVLEGDVDLGSEKLDLRLEPKSETITLNVSVPVRIRGTFANPTFAPDELAAARRLGALAGGLLFPPAALAAFADLGGGDTPCVDRVAAEAKAGAGAGEKGDTIQRANDAVKGAIEGIGNTLKGLFGN